MTLRLGLRYRYISKDIANVLIHYFLGTQLDSPCSCDEGMTNRSRHQSALPVSPK
jgi:hypothetical protein